MSCLLLQNALRTLLLPLCSLLTLCANANDNERLLHLGDAAYRQKSYDSAISYYEQAAAGKSPDVVALYKLGNAHYRLRHIAEAMLSYQRVLQRQPGFAPAAHNARLIQKQVQPGGDKEVFFVRWWRAIAAPQTSNLWALLAVIIFAGIIGTLAWTRLSKRNLSWLRPQVTVAALALTALFAAMSLSAALRDVPRSVAVVMRPDTKFRPVTSKAKSSGYSLPEGLLIKVLHRQNDDVTVALPDGQEGFVQKTDIVIIE